MFDKTFLDLKFENASIFLVLIDNPFFQMLSIKIDTFRTFNV